jgi:Insulinase (Peptidase family M16)
MRNRAVRTALTVFVVSMMAALGGAQDVASFEKHITVRKLPNGLTAMVYERPEAPVFSFFTHVDAGSAQDPLAKTGLAHMFEHMAFKGTDKIGTRDYAAEKVALQKVEAAYAAYLVERDKRIDRNDQKVKELEKAWKDAVAEANKYVKPNEFGQIVESEGGEGMNAFTNYDETAYHYSFPSKQPNWTPAGAIHYGGIPGQPVPPADHRLDVGLEFLFRQRCGSLFSRVLHPIQHGGGGGG